MYITLLDHCKLRPALIWGCFFTVTWFAQFNSVRHHQWTQFIPPEFINSIVLKGCAREWSEDLWCLQSDAGGWTLGVAFCGRESCFHWLKHKLCSLSGSICSIGSWIMSLAPQPPPRSLLALWRSSRPDAELLPAASAVQQQRLRLDQRSYFTDELHCWFIFWVFNSEFLLLRFFLTGLTVILWFYVPLYTKITFIFFIFYLKHENK